MTQATIHLTYTNSAWYIRYTSFFRRKAYQLELPQNWEEVNPAKLSNVFHTLATRDQSESLEADLLLDVVDVPARLMLKLGAEQVAERLLPFLTWMTTAPLILPPVDHIMSGHERLMLAHPYFSDRNLGWYRSCEEAFESMKDQPAELQLNDFLACYFFSDQETVMGITPGMAYFTLFYYMSTRQWLFDKHLPTGNDDPETKQAETSKADDLDWDVVYLDIAERGPFGAVHRVPDIGVPTFFKWMGKNHREFIIQKRKALQESIRSHHQNFVA
jgi:hypothetical protein